MGSHTYHCVGICASNNGKRRVYLAMNRREMAQQAKIAEKAGNKIIEWEAQTKTGRRLIGSPCAPASEVRLPKMVTCPICNGIGRKTIQRGENGALDVVRLCPVCNGSGITSPGYWNHWQDWQLERMRSEFDTQSGGDLC